MEVESVPYIFGSFNRRKSSHAHAHSEPNAGNFDSRKLPNSLTVPDAPKGNHAHSRSQPETGNGAHGVSNPNKQLDDRALRTRSCNLNLKPRADKALSATCSICNHVYLEPRVLECLHSFCTRCLQDIVEKNREQGEVWLPRDDVPEFDHIFPEKASSNEDIDVNQIICPTCTERTPLSRHGVLGLPPDYVVQHRLVLATLNDENTKLLCDLCTGDVVAIERCSQCLVNLCPVCGAVHRRHARTTKHEVLRLREVRRRGLMRIHRHLMCHVHPECELVAYCTTCEQTACPICINHHHANHHYTPCPPAASAHNQRLRRLLGRARGAAARDQALRRRLLAARRAVQHRCCIVVDQVEQHMEEYRRLVEGHREKLLSEIESIRTSLLSHLSTFESSLTTRLQSSSTTINFTHTLLEEGSDVELLTFVNKLLKKLEFLEQPVKIAEELKELLKQTVRDRSSEHDGLVDFVPQNTVKDFEVEKSSRNFDVFQRPIRHVLVDFVPSKDEIIIEENKHSKLLNRDKSVSSIEDCGKRNSKNVQEAVDKTSSNKKINIPNDDKKTSSLKRKSNNSVDQKLDEVSSKPVSGILHQLKNCLENHEDKKISPTKLEESSKIISQKLENNKSHQNSQENLLHSDSSDDTIILEFLPQEPEILTEGAIPVIFGQIRRLTTTSVEANNCCSATRPHLGGNPSHKIVTCCGHSMSNQSNNRKSEVNGKVYQITI